MRIRLSELRQIIRRVIVEQAEVSLANEDEIVNVKDSSDFPNDLQGDLKGGYIPCEVRSGGVVEWYVAVNPKENSGHKCVLADPRGGGSDQETRSIKLTDAQYKKCKSKSGGFMSFFRK